MNIDYWTVLLQAINLLVLVALLRWLFFQPLLAVIDARQKMVQDQLTDAATARKEAQQQAAELVRERKQLDLTSESVLQAAKDLAKQDTAATLKKVKNDADSIVHHAQAQIARERRDATHAIYDEASILATALAKRLLGTVSASSADEPFFDALFDQIYATPDNEREQWFAEGTKREVSVFSAHSLESDARTRVSERLQEMLGKEIVVHFSTDGALIAGASIRFAHGVVGSNWAAELARANVTMLRASQQVAAE